MLFAVALEQSETTVDSFSPPLFKLSHLYCTLVLFTLASKFNIILPRNWAKNYGGCILLRVNVQCVEPDKY